MSTVILKLAGPLQAWGSESRFTERKTSHEPTKSGVVGLISAALGRRRTDDVSDLAACAMGVRIDQPGTYERDFQTAHTRKYDAKTGRWVFDKSLPLSNRYYLADAVFVVGLEMDDEMAEKVAQALMHPQFPLYLGRRSCSPSQKVLYDIAYGVELKSALASVPWQATKSYMRRASNAGGFGAPVQAAEVELTLVRDLLVGDEDSLVRDIVRDVPLSFSPEHRDFGWRTVVVERMSVKNPLARTVVSDHDPMVVIEEAMQ